MFIEVPMKTRVVALGAGFGGLELTAILAELVPDDVDLVLIDQSDSFVFGFSKIDVLLGRCKTAAVRLPYSAIVAPGVRFVQAPIESIDPAARRVVTAAGTFDADILIVALGADVDPSATPGLREGGHEFYTLTGAAAAHDALSSFPGGRVVIGVHGLPFKCPPAPSEAALLVHEYLVSRGRRAEVSIVMPFDTPVPPSPDTSKALVGKFAEHGITFVRNNFVTSLDPNRHVARLSDGFDLPYDLFLGVPVHRVPPVVIASGLSSGPDDWVKVNPQTLETQFPGVYAVGDVNAVGTPKAGVFAEGAAQTVAAIIVAKLKSGEPPPPFAGRGSCYVDFGGDMVGRVDVDFLGGPKPTSRFEPASKALAGEKSTFTSTRRTRWFGGSEG
jgi:sulfide:quinone oxidoreductase